jgi:hypothetical protein
VDNQPPGAISDMIDSDAEVSDSEEDLQGLLRRWMFGEVEGVASSLLMSSDYGLLPLFLILLVRCRKKPP